MLMHNRNMGNTNTEIHKWLSVVLAQSGLTPTGLAKKSKLATTTITRFLKDPENSPTLSIPTINKISAATGIAYEKSGVTEEPRLFRQVGAMFLNSLKAEGYDLDGDSIMDILMVIQDLCKKPDFAQNPDRIVDRAMGMVLARQV